MFKTLWTRICTLFKSPLISKTSDIRNVGIIEYNDIINRIRNATTLAELLNIRTKIRNLHQYVIENKQERWGRTFIHELTRIWKLRYEHWKRKTRRG